MHKIIRALIRSLAWKFVFSGFALGFALQPAQGSDQTDIPKETTPNFELYSGSLGHVAVASVAGTINTQASVFGASVGTGLLGGIPGVTLGYYWKKKKLQLLASPSFNILVPSAGGNNQPSDGTTMSSRLTVGVAYYFSDEVRSSYFLRADSGVVLFKSGGVSTAAYVGNIQFGKKIFLHENLALSPTFMVEVMTTQPNMSLAMSFTPLQLSLLL